MVSTFSAAMSLCEIHPIARINLAALIEPLDDGSSELLCK
jgi:hypothetical protein